MEVIKVLRKEDLWLVEYGKILRELEENENI